ncbi:hypothetical protein HDU79_008296 [Rhizoclosmatium sp. JEL0117]|nr:hypothetical protein HDU79_008296 [Rhizoclosmatium sp. JEL0117]
MSVAVCSTAWSVSQPNYYKDDKVSYQGVNYVAKWWTSPHDVPSAGGPWDSLGACGGQASASGSVVTATSTQKPVTGFVTASTRPATSTNLYTSNAKAATVAVVGLFVSFILV